MTVHEQCVSSRALVLTLVSIRCQVRGWGWCCAKCHQIGGKLCKQLLPGA
jgi:hypothetical protein